MTDLLEAYNVVWDSPSKDASGSMPLGNGDLGVNAWVEESSGDLLLLIGKTDAWDENSINLKLGRVRVRLSPNPIVPGTPFRQTLKLRTAEIEIVAEPVTITVRVDANHPVIFVDAASTEPIEMQASLEMWRTEARTIKTQTGDMFRNLSGTDPYPTIVWPDQVLKGESDRIVWCHHSQRREHDAFEINMKLQGLGDLIDQMPHPLIGRTFGGAIEGDRFVSADATTLKSRQPAREHRLRIHALSRHPASIEDWTRQLDQLIQSSRDASLEEHRRWWDEFWNRSWIFVSTSNPNELEAAFNVTRGYILQRFMNAAAGRGASPIKHNGSIFTVGKPDDPDFRRWGGPGFWFMNQRLIYWPMLAAGDYDLMRPWLNMYLQMLPLARHRTQKYFGHGGAHFPETVTFWGAEISAHYGWTPFDERSRPEAECSYVTYLWQGGIELVLILLNYHLHTGDDDFAREILAPIKNAVTEFYRLHYRRDANGKLRIEPAQALETWHDATNPVPELAGLCYALDLLQVYPALPVGERDGRKVILPAERFDKKKNTENPELYCIFPYRLFGVGKPDLQLARDTFAARLHQSHDCWSQDDIQMAMLGLTDQAKQNVTKRAAPASHSDSRFPAFWNAFKDWVPDIDHGGVLQMALQAMLMQCEVREIRLLPAWPKDWEVDFKLHAPYRTIVEGKVREGTLVELRVTPELRRKDIVFD